MDRYFSKANGCFPILHDTLLHRERDDSRPPASPAVMACLYAHAIIYWGRDAELARHRRPDGRFLWNMALDALYSELHLSPGIPCIVAVLLNVGGRPTTTMLGNGMLLGCAISLAHCLGLNRNPVPWDIPDEEKGLRMQIWWCLLIHDRWSVSLYKPYTPPSHTLPSCWFVVYVSC